VISIVFEATWDDLEFIGYCDTHDEAEAVVVNHNKNLAPGKPHWYIEDLERIALEE